MSGKSETVTTYDNSARALARYFMGIGVRSADIDLVFSLAANQYNPKVLEIGCGDGRDAIEILKYTRDYTGMDISKGMLEIAKEKVPNTTFHQADIAEYEFPQNVDVIFSFASLLHSSIDEVKLVFDRAHNALTQGGVFYVSLKYMHTYTQKIKEDEYGRRLFYFYNPEELKGLAGDKYEIAFLDFQKIENTDWFSIVFVKSD